jgi:uncharacterized protein YjbJ (UPF0337 family)
MAAPLDFGRDCPRTRRRRDSYLRAPVPRPAGSTPAASSTPCCGGVRHVGAARPDRGSVHPLGVTFAVGVSLDEEVSDVGFADKLNNQVRKLRGRIKRNVGEVTGDRNLQAAGRAEEVGGNRNRIGEKIKDAFRGRGRQGRRHN